MAILDTLRKSIHSIGIKEIARRSGLSPSTVSRVNAGTLAPSLDVTLRISRAAGYQIEIHPLKMAPEDYVSRLDHVLRTLRGMKGILRDLGVRHVTVFGSMARKEDRPDSDIDLYIDYGGIKPLANKMLPIEGRILDAFPDTKVDFVTDLSTPKGRRLRYQIEKDGCRAF